MKKFIRTLVVALLCFTVLTITVNAAAERIDLSHVYVELTIPDGFEAVTPDNLAEHQKLLDYIGKTQEGMANDMTREYVEMYSMKLDKSCEITLQVYKIDAFDVFDLMEADEATVTSIIENIKNDSNYTCHSTEVIDTDDAKFIKVERTDAVGINTITYTTVKNGANYALTLTKPDTQELTQADRDSIDFVFNSFSFTETIKNPNKYKWLVYLMVAALIGVSAAIIYVVIKRSKGWGDKSFALKSRNK